MNPRHLILETSVLPTELRTRYEYYNLNKLKLQYLETLIHSVNYKMKQFRISKRQILIEKSLPHNFLAEKMILNCLLINFEAIELTIETIPIKAFYFKNHQEIYKAIIFMYKNKLPIDIFTLSIFLQDNGSVSYTHLTLPTICSV